MKLPLQTFTAVCDNSRFTFYETWFNKTKAIVEVWWEDVWSIKSSISIPKALFILLRAECVLGINPSIFNSTDTVENPFTKTIVYERFELPYGVRQLLFDIDCRNIPFSENQLGCMTDLESLEWYWDIGILQVPLNHHKKLHVLCRQRLPTQFKSKLLVTVQSNQKLAQIRNACQRQRSIELKNSKRRHWKKLSLIWQTFDKLF